MSNARNLANLLGTKTKVKDVDVDGTELILDSDGDSSITSDTDDQIDFKAGGTDVMAMSTTGLTVTNATNDAQLTLTSTDADASEGPKLDLYRNSASPADNDAVGRIVFSGENDADEKVDLVRIIGTLSDASDGSEDGMLQYYVTKDGTRINRLTHTPTETSFNDDSADVDFRVESNGNANMLIVDGGNDVMSIGRAINTASTLSIQNKDDANNNTLDLFNDNGNRTISMQQDTTGNAKLILQKNDGTNAVRLDANLGGILFGTDTAAANTLDDYEEGTFTPAFAQSGATIGYSSQAGTYTKVGRLVHATARLITSSVSGGSGAITITGLPFTSLSSHDHSPVLFATVFSGWSSTNAPKAGYISNGSSTIQVVTNDSSDARDALDSSVTSFGDGSVGLIFGAIYPSA